jgi:hypothetical protein
MNKETLDQLVSQDASDWNQKHYRPEVLYAPDCEVWYVIQVLDGYYNGESYEDARDDETVEEEYGPYSDKEVRDILHEAFLIPTELKLEFKSFEYTLHHGPYSVDCQFEEGAQWRKLVVKPITNKPKEEWVKYALRAKTKSLSCHHELVKQQIAGLRKQTHDGNAKELRELLTKEAALVAEAAKIGREIDA